MSMYLSCLPIDVSQVRGRTWLANPYRVHQRLLMAFPDGKSERLLFRIEAGRTPPRIIVQSSLPAVWDRAFLDHPVLLGRTEQKEVSPAPLLATLAIDSHSEPQRRQVVHRLFPRSAERRAE